MALTMLRTVSGFLPDHPSRGHSARELKWDFELSHVYNFEACFSSFYFSRVSGHREVQLSSDHGIIARRRAPDGNGLNTFTGKPTNRSPEDLNGKTAAVHIPDTSADFAMRLARKAPDFLIMILGNPFFLRIRDSSLTFTNVKIAKAKIILFTPFAQLI